MTFEQAYVLTKGVSDWDAYHETELRALWGAVTSLPSRSVVVEVGCEFGKSSSLLAQAAKANGLELVFIDPFLPPHDRAFVSFAGLMHSIGVPFTLHKRQTVAVPVEWLPTRIGLVHIDGDHYLPGIRTDCERLLPRVAIGGFAAFHDYGRDSLPHVYPTANEWLKPESWKPYSHVETCYIAQRIGD